MQQPLLNPFRLLSLPRFATGRAGVLLLGLCLSWTAPPDGIAQDTASGNTPVQFTNVTREAGIDFHLTCGTPEKLYIMDELCGGVAWLDYDNDGWMDLLLINGSTLERLREGSSPPAQLFRNRGDGSFEDVTGKAGIDFRGWGMGIAVGDYDNDGWPDVYITHLQGGRLYRNQGNGTFQDVTRGAGVDNRGRWGTSAAFGDYDNDGDLDLYVANYVRLDLDNLAEFGSSIFCTYRGIKVACGPRGLAGERDRLFRNNGDGTFADVTETLGIDPDEYYGLGVLWWDHDLDGDPDVYIANDSTPSLLYSNNGDGTFEEVGSITGVAYSADGHAQAGMGVDSADYDNDGWPDLVKTNFSDDVNNLYHNDGDGWFSDLGGEAGYARISVRLLAFGVRLFDYDNDGWLDIYIANGHVNPQMDDHSFGVTYRQRDLLFHNLKSGRFEEVSEKVGLGMTADFVARGLATADYDNDGDLDLLITNLENSPVLLRNDGGNRNHWLQVRLIGSSSNRDGFGARVKVVAGGLTQTAYARAGSSYLSSHDPRLVFGLGAAGQVDLLEVRWPSGKVQTIPRIEGNQEVVVREQDLIN